MKWSWGPRTWTLLILEFDNSTAVRAGSTEISTGGGYFYEASLMGFCAECRIHHHLTTNGKHANHLTEGQLVGRVGSWKRAWHTPAKNYACNQDLTNSGGSESFLKSSRSRKAMKGSYRLLLYINMMSSAKFTYNLKMVHIISLGFCSDVKVMTFATFSFNLRPQSRPEVRQPEWGSQHQNEADTEQSFEIGTWDILRS